MLLRARCLQQGGGWSHRLPSATGVCPHITHVFAPRTPHAHHTHPPQAARRSRPPSADPAAPARGGTIRPRLAACTVHAFGPVWLCTYGPAIITAPCMRAQSLTYPYAPLRTPTHPYVPLRTPTHPYVPLRTPTYPYAPLRPTQPYAPLRPTQPYAAHPYALRTCDSSAGRCPRATTSRAAPRPPAPAGAPTAAPGEAAA